MIKIENYENCTPSGITYGGYSGSKKGIIINNKRWFLKYPKSTKSMDVTGISYTTSPISEYIGTQIYKLLGFEAHETTLGFANNKIVVACKDFLKENEIILDYNSIKNDYNETVEKKLEELSSSSNNKHGTDIDETSIIMNNNEYFKKIPTLKEHFWNMFIVDALINNNDRNDNNWGLILNQKTMNLRIAPVYDNGASFYSKTNNEKITNILNDRFKTKQVIYDNCISNFTKNGKTINSLKYIENMNNIDCNKALLKIFPKINLNKIKEIFDNIPEYHNTLQVLSKEQKKLYYNSIVYKYENVFKPIYEKLTKQD